MILVVLNQLVKWILANHIRVEHKEQAFSVVLSDNLFSKSNRSCSTHWLTLERTRDLDVVLNPCQFFCAYLPTFHTLLTLSS